MSLTDRRALMGGLSLVISGAVITVMLLQYLAGVGETGFSRSRLWWEVAMNLQLLAAGLMWFCYADRIDDSRGQVRSLNWLRLGFGMYGVLLPGLIAIVGAVNDWFLERPGDGFLILFALAMYSVWQIGVLIDWFVRRRIYKEKSNDRQVSSKPPSLVSRVVLYLPIILLVVITIFCWVNDDAWWVLAIPIFVYMQGSMPFFIRAFGKQL